jgi:hypothetical protein
VVTLQLNTPNQLSQQTLHDALTVGIHNSTSSSIEHFETLLTEAGFQPLIGVEQTLFDVMLSICATHHDARMRLTAPNPLPFPHLSVIPQDHGYTFVVHATTDREMEEYEGDASLLIELMEGLVSTSTPIGTQRLMTLYRGNEKIVQTVLATILANFPRENRLFAEAVMKGEVSEIARTAHRIRPIVNMLDADKLEGALRDLEENAHRYKPHDLQHYAIGLLLELRKLGRAALSLGS